MITPWRVVAVTCAVFAIAGAFVGGRFSAPLKVETRNVDRVVYQDRIVEKVVTVEKAAQAVTKVVYRDRVIKGDTETVHEVETTDTHSNTETSTNVDAVASHSGESTHTNTVITTLRSDWRVSLLAGASFGKPLITVTGPLVLGFEIDRRIIGGLSAGVWINTFGAAGVALSLEF